MISPCISQMNKLLLCGVSHITNPSLSSTTGDYDWKTVKDMKCQRDVEECLTISETSFEYIGKILTDRGELSLSYFFTTLPGLRKFEQTLNEKKIGLSKLYFRFTGLNADCCDIVGRIVKQCKIGELMMHGCEVNSVTLGHLLETFKETKIINFDVARNKFDANCCEVIANIVTQCSVDKLNLAACNITNKVLDQFLISAREIKLFKLDVSGNYLTPSAIKKISESISVKELVNHGQNRKKSTSSGSTNLDHVDKEIKRILTQPITKAQEIGPEGGAIDLHGCRLTLLPGAHQTQRRAKISVRSLYEDAPEGYIIASPEINCDTCGILFEGFVTISLQLHAIPGDGHIDIISKQDNNSDWQIINVDPTLADRKVSFRVDHFSLFKAVIRSASCYKIHLCHYIFFCSSTSELRSLTCIDNDAVKKDCIDTLKGEDFKLCPDQPDKIILCDREKVLYKYRCIKPEGHRLELDTEDVTRNGFITHRQKSFKLLPCPEQDASIIEIECVRTTSSGSSTSVLRLEWKTPVDEEGRQVVGNTLHEEPMVIHEVGNPRADVHQRQEEPRPIVHEQVRNMEITTSTRGFYELHHNAEDVYPIYCNRTKGKVLIINNEFLGQNNERVGSEVDLRNLEDLWRGMGFIVDIKTNLTADRMLDTCKENVSVVIVIIMSHGGTQRGQEFVTGEDGNAVLSHEIISFFSSNNCLNLCGIPKVIMLQACRGGNVDGPDVQKDATNEVQPLNAAHPERIDMLLVYPSQSGCFSYRDPVNGSRLINAVVTVFKRHAHDTHMLDMLTKVNNEVAPEEGRLDNIQGSNHVSHLRKKLFLLPGWP